MLVLLETPEGFALFKVLDEGKLSKVEDLWKEFDSIDSARQVVKLKAFSKFGNTGEPLSVATYLIEGKPYKGLCKFLRAHCEGETLAVANPKLGNAIKKKLHIECIYNNVVMELMRGIRSQLTKLLSGLAIQDLDPMSLGLSHSFSRYKPKFSSEKDDITIIQAIRLLDYLDKELNTYTTRVHECYGWHFPELTNIVQDNVLYVKAVKFMGNRTNAANLDFSEILPEEVEIELKEAAMISRGTEVIELDLINIRGLCDRILSLSEYRAQLYDYLKRKMNIIAPNLTALVGELVGARLITHRGSLLNLAKQPSSRIQILGVEQALSRALKTEHATPKCGLIYHASQIGQEPRKLKWKISRPLAAKIALCIRCDALGDNQDNSMGLKCRAKLEAWLTTLEGRGLGRFAGSSEGKPKIEVYDIDRKKGAEALITAAKTYNPAAESTFGQAAIGYEEDTGVKKTTAEEPLSSPNKEEKKKKKKKKTQESDIALQIDGVGCAEQQSNEMSKKEKKKKKKQAFDEVLDVENLEDGYKKKKKKRKYSEEDEKSKLPSKKKGKK